MTKYLIKWDAGYGECYDVIDANDENEALNVAYEAWHDAVQSQAEYGAEILTDELADEYGV